MMIFESGNKCKFSYGELLRNMSFLYFNLYSFAVRDASYVRLRTLSLGYNIPQKTFSKVGIRQSRVYLTGTNLLTFTDFRSYSPEQTPLNNNNQNASAFPETRNITVGVKLGF